jgi:hypothetical protein
MAHREPVAPEDEPTIGKLVVDASRDISTLIQSEISLAKSELRVSIKTGGLSIALFALAGFLSVLAVIMLSVAIAYLIAKYADLDLAWCFLIVFGAYLLLAGLLGLLGYRKVRRVRAPQRAMAQARQMPSAFKRS